MCTLVAGLVPACAAASTLTLQEALEQALSAGLQAESARLERSQGRQALAEGVASALPGLSAAYSTSGTSLAEVGETWHFGFSLTQPVVDAAVVFDIMRGFRENESYRARSGLTVAELILAVQAGYYELARGQALVASAERQHRRAAENSKTVARRRELGEASLADGLRAEADLLTKEAELLGARHGLEESQRAFSDLVGLGRWEAIEVEALPPPAEPGELPETVVAAAALEGNPEVAVLRTQARASDLAYWGAWGDLLPALSFSYNRGSTFGGTLFPGEEREDVRYGLVVSLPVVDVAARVLGITGARLDREVSRLELAQAELEARERLAGLVARQELSYKEWASAAKTVELSEEVYRLNARSYELGAVSFDDLLQVEAELAQAERALIEAGAGYWSSRAELNYVLGVAAEE